MKTKSVIVIGAAIATALGGLASATPQKGVSAFILMTGTQTDSIEVHGSAKTSGEGFQISLETEGPATISTSMSGLNAGGQNGWHSHPGMVIVTLTKGSIQWYDAACKLTVHNAGETWMEGSQVHYLRTLGTITAQFVSTFIVAQGQPYRTDEQAPPCAQALGLDQ
jgi:quercetin dioxygenase-like cupin family protein